MPTTEVNLLVLSKVNLRKIIEKMPAEMKDFIKLAKSREKYHKLLIIRSLTKDKEAYKLFKASQKIEEINPYSPAQFIVRMLRGYLETKRHLNQFEEKLLRIMGQSPVCASDSEDGVLEGINVEHQEDTSSDSSER
jgi:hypothetical protein